MSTQWERARQPTIGFPKKEGHKLPYFWGWYVSRQDTSFGLWIVDAPPGRHLPVANGGYSFKYWIAKSQGDNGVAGGGGGD